MSYAPIVSYRPGLWTVQFQFLCKVIFSRFLAEHEQKFKTGLWSSSYSPLQLVKKYLTLFLIVTPYFVWANSRSKIKNCWFIDIYLWHTFHVNQTLYVDLTHRWVLPQLQYYLGNHKTGSRGTKFVLDNLTKKSRLNDLF